MPLDSSSVLEVHGDSSIELKLSNNDAKTFAYNVWFLSTKPDGTLLIFSSLFNWEQKSYFANDIIYIHLYSPFMVEAK